jgi:hypothetical protein
MMDLTALFLKAYSNLPEDEQDQVIVIIDSKTYTWNRAYDEVKNETALGEKILKRLHELEILNEREQ